MIYGRDIEDPHDVVGHYVAYDSEHGAAWAKIVEVRYAKGHDGKGNVVDNPVFVVDELCVRHGSTVQLYDGRVLHMAHLADAMFVDVPDLEDGGMSEDVEDAIFCAVMAQGTEGQRTALELGLGGSLKDLLRKQVEAE